METVKYDATALNYLSKHRFIELQEGALLCVNLLQVKYAARLKHQCQTGSKDDCHELMRQLRFQVKGMLAHPPAQHTQDHRPAHLLYKVETILGDGPLARVVAVQEMLPADSSDAGAHFVPDPSYEQQAMKLFVDYDGVNMAYAQQELALSLMNLGPRRYHVEACLQLLDRQDGAGLWTRHS